MTRRKVPEIATLIDDCITKLGDIIHQRDVSATTLRDCANTLIAIDKNNRDLKIAIRESIVPDMTTEEIEAELERTRRELRDEE